MSNEQSEKIPTAILEQSFKQFSLESERLEWIYQNLEARFSAIQENLKESHLRMSAKLAELNFTTVYLKTILDHISQGIIFINTHGIVTTYNRAAQEILGIPEKELFFRPFSEKFKDDFLGFSLKEAMQTKTCPKTNFVNWILANDEKFELEIETTFVMMHTEMSAVGTCQPLKAPVHGLLVLMRNLTEMRRLQLIVNRHDVLKELGEMAAHLAHEIRNPLGGIKGFASLLYQDLSTNPPLQEMAGHIVQGTDDLNRLVTAILHYTRTFQLHLESVNLIKFFEEMKVFIETDQSWNPSINFTINSSAKEIFVPIDSQLFKSALLNLIINAAQAMPNGGDLTVSINCDANDAFIQIGDTGTGIKPEHLTKIFSPFFTTKQTGTGLGLAEVHKVIQAHGGWIGIESEVGKGTCVKVRIPLKIKE